MMFLSSCNSNKVIEKTIVYVPEVDWPELPKLPDYEITENGILVKDENYFRQMLVFKTEYQTEIDKYNEKLEKLEERKMECELCANYLENGICTGDENGRVDQTGENKCFRIKNKLSQEDIDAKIKDKKFTILEDGKTTICNIYLENGFTVRGESACVDPSNFNKEIGEKIAYENAKNKIWLLEGYLLQEKNLSK